MSSNLAGQAMLDKQAEDQSKQNEIRARVCAFIDGAVTDEESQVVIDHLLHDGAWKDVWSEYHALSDALLAGTAQVNLSNNFAARVQQQIALEPLHFRPGKPTEQRARYRWISMGAIAAGVAFVLWAGLPIVVTQSPDSQYTAHWMDALRPPPISPNSRQAQLPAEFDPYLQAHQQSVGWARLQILPSHVRYAEESGQLNTPAASRSSVTGSAAASVLPAEIKPRAVH